MINKNKCEWRLDYGGREIVLESGRLAKQADGSVLISCEGTQVLVTVCSATEAKEGQDFFPLLVEYTEKFYSVGKFLGGFRKREGRPSDGEALNARLIDRPLRPLFPEGYSLRHSGVLHRTFLLYRRRRPGSTGRVGCQCRSDHIGYSLCRTHRIMQSGSH